MILSGREGMGAPMSAIEKCPACGVENPLADHRCIPKDVVDEVMRQVDAGSPTGWRWLLYAAPALVGWGVYKQGATIGASVFVVLVLSGLIEGISWIIRKLR
jgi:hypothetical protein